MDNKIREENWHLDSHGRKMPVFVAQPDSPAQACPAIIVVHEIFGLNDHIRDVARRFAKQGLVAFAPDFFEGATNMPANHDDLNGMRAVWQGIPDSQFVADFQSLFEQATKSDFVDSNRVGVIGYCMGGAMALMFASTTPGVAWIADYYGRIQYPELSENKPQHPVDYVRNLRCPFLGLFSGQDELIPAADVDLLRERLRSSGQHFELKVYEDAKHAFFNDRREFYNEAAATDAWKKTMQFITNVSHSAVG